MSPPTVGGQKLGIPIKFCQSKPTNMEGTVSASNVYFPRSPDLFSTFSSHGQDPESYQLDNTAFFFIRSSQSP